MGYVEKTAVLYSQGYKYNSSVTEVTSVTAEYLEFSNLIAY